MCKVLRVKKTNLYDAFFGEGWKEHTRVFWDGKTLDIVSGAKLTRYQKFMVESQITSLVSKEKVK